MLLHEVINVPFPIFEDYEPPDLEARRREREKFREVDVGNTSVMINPYPSDLARMLVRDNQLRAVSSPSTLAVWPAEEGLHQPILRALDMEERARRYFLNATRHGRFKVGRFQVDVEADNGDHIEPGMLPRMMRRALNVRA